MKTFPFIFNKPLDVWQSLQPKEWADFILGELNPRFSFTATKAKVVGVVSETADAKTFVLKPNWLWKGFKAGQHTPVTVEIGGRRVTRFYSLSSAPNEKYISVTIKRQQGGLVSNFLNEKTKLGDVWELGNPTGDFSLDSNTKENILCLAGGSGITPIHSIIRDLGTKNFDGKLTLLYFAKSFEDLILYSSIERLKSQHSWLTVHYIFSDVPKEGYVFGFLSEEIVNQFLPNYKEHSIMVCGPGPMQTKAISMFEGCDLKSELFLLPTQIKTKMKKDSVVEVTLTKSFKTIELKGERSILEELEEQGIFPPSGCRMGICHTCVCKKNTGSVTDLATGEVSELGEENIQLCVSRAENNLELEL
ncbi:iron-sulfur cluster-binding domain-containing protein [Leptospira sp. 96542]|nr:iron-sulfur cluster-binding domain-containing protein [Leptospira sp. 96542]